MKRHSGLQCPICRMRMFSWFRHDYRTCFCGSVMVDGGFDYLRCGWEPGVKARSIRWTPNDWAPQWYLVELALVEVMEELGDGR